MEVNWDSLLASLWALTSVDWKEYTSECMKVAMLAALMDVYLQVDLKE